MRTLIAIVIAATAGSSAAVLAAQAARQSDVYSFVVAAAPKDAFDERKRVRFNRWSTDAERQQLLAALDDPATLLSTLPYTEVVGYLQWPGGLEHSVRYARRTARPDGGADIVMVVERPLWLWWDPNAKWDADQQFSVVQLRVNRDGTGEGRVATGSGFTRDAVNGLVIPDAATPALLTEVRREAPAS